MMNIRWGRYIPSALRVITAACATGYAARCVKPAAFPRRCFITSRHLPSVFSISITGTFEAAYFLGHHPNPANAPPSPPRDDAPPVQSAPARSAAYHPPAPARAPGQSPHRYQSRHRPNAPCNRSRARPHPAPPDARAGRYIPAPAKLRQQRRMQIHHLLRETCHQRGRDNA